MSVEHCICASGQATGYLHAPDRCCSLTLASNHELTNACAPKNGLNTTNPAVPLHQCRSAVSNKALTLSMCVGKSDLQVYKQKVKHLLYEHQNSLTSLKADHEMWLKMQSEESSKRELDLQKDKRNLKQESKEQVALMPGPQQHCRSLL